MSAWRLCILRTAYLLMVQHRDDSRTTNGVNAPTLPKAMKVPTEPQHSVHVDRQSTCRQGQMRIQLTANSQHSGCRRSTVDGQPSMFQHSVSTNQRINRINKSTNQHVDISVCQRTNLSSIYQHVNTTSMFHPIKVNRSTVNYQLSTINHQPSTFSNQHSATNAQHVNIHQSTADVNVPQ